MTILELQNVTGGYTRKPVIENLSFTIGKGELVGLIGLNGAGKSTTIKHIIGTLIPREGEIRLNGIALGENMEAYRAQFSYIPETPVLYEELTLKEHLEMTAMAYGLEESEWEKRAELLLKEFRMERRLNWFPSHFSKGMRQKVMIMCAFLVNPSLYIIDEPFVGLDPKAAHTLKEMMRAHCDGGGAIFFSTHVLEVAEKLCDKVAIIRAGKLIKDGTMDEVKGDDSLEEVFLELVDTEGAQ